MATLSLAEAYSVGDEIYVFGSHSVHAGTVAGITKTGRLSVQMPSGERVAFTSYGRKVGTDAWNPTYVYLPEEGKKRLAAAKLDMERNKLRRQYHALMHDLNHTRLGSVPVTSTLDSIDQLKTTVERYYALDAE